MVADLVRQVAGERGQVEGVIAEGVDPHLYAATTSDVKALRNGDVIFYNGLNLEGKMTGVLAKMAEGKPVCAVAEAFDGFEDYAIKASGDQIDPHIWMDVSGWMRALAAVSKTLNSYDPSFESHYTKRAESYLTMLKKLDEYVRGVVETIPLEQRVLVTAHDAFGYMARAYGFEVRGVQGLSTEAKPGLRDIEMLVDFLVERKIPAVFVESSVSQKSVEALIEGARAQGHRVVIGGQLFSDSMGPAGTFKGTYVGMMDHNVNTIAGALGGVVPDGGFREWSKSKP
jgi:manganese/zinc/iron transport system substrate-binding protein